MSNNNEELNQDELFAGLQESSTGYDQVVPPDNSPVPDGNYVVVVEKVSLGMTLGDAEKNIPKKPKLEWTMKIVESTDAAQVGKKMFRNNVISPETVKFYKRDMVACGLDMPPSELPTKKDQLVGLFLKVRVWRKKGEQTRYNVEVDGLDGRSKENASGGEDAFAQPQQGVDDAPF